MRIKEVEKRTGLTAKAIRLYESKGLLKPARETENDYRDYMEEDVARLKTIAILRKLDIPVKTIKDWTDGKTPLRELLEQAANQNREASRESDLRRKLAEELAELLEEDPEADLGEAAAELEELNGILSELEAIMEVDGGHVGTPLYSTLLALGSIAGTVFGILDGAEPDALLLGLGADLVLCVICTLNWRRYLTTPKRARTHNGCLSLLLLGVGMLAAAMAFWMWMSDLQLERYTAAPSDIVLQRPWQLVAVIFLMVELTAVAGLLSPMREETMLMRWMKKGKRQALILAVAVLVANWVMFHGAVTGVSVANEAGIMRYSFFDPDGTFYSYEDVERVETGFKGKFLGIPVRNTGTFYYKITYSDGVTENWGESTDQTENNTWTWMQRLDEWCLAGGAEKEGSDQFSEYCDMEQYYVDILVDVINNR